ncbi:MAG: CrcB family protein [Balneolales bacterium]|nr:CrcB family protein [Balneolales bacterium]
MNSMFFIDMSLVAAGGALGAVLRYLVFVFCANRNFSGFIPTILVNLTGCFLAGLFTGWLLNSAEPEGWTALLVLTGFLSAFTTFSTFVADGILMINNRQYVRLFAIIFISVGGGLGAAHLGFLLISLI